MKIRHYREGESTVLQFSGRIDELAMPELELALTGLVKEGARQVALDLSGVDYISSSGLGMLLMLLRALVKQEGQLVLCELTPFVSEVFNVTNFDTMFTIRPTLDQALSVLQSSQ